MNGGVLDITWGRSKGALVLAAILVALPAMVVSGARAAAPALQIDLDGPHGPVVDKAGNLYISDTFNNKVLKYTAGTRLVSTLAGTGSAGFSGDGGTAGLAQVNAPNGLALDSMGNLYLVDTYNHRIRKINLATKIITTVAGSSTTFGFDNGDFSGDGGPATAAELDTPQGVAVDAAGNLFIGDTYNHRVRMVDASTGVITTIAGTGNFGNCCNGQFFGDGGPATSAGLYQPTRIVLDKQGNMLFSDTYNHRVRRIDVATGMITTIAGSGPCCGAVGSFSGDFGPATFARFHIPYGLALDGVGNLFVADACNHRVRKILAGISLVITVAGSGLGSPFGCELGGFSGDGGPAVLAELSFPYGVAFRSGTLYIGDFENDRIRTVNRLGTIKTIVGQG